MRRVINAQSRIITILIAVILGLSLTALVSPLTAQAAKKPAVVSTSPVNGAVNVAVAVQPTATWSQNINPAGLTWTFKKTSNGQNVAATMTYNATALKVTLTPSVPLAASTKYTVSMKTPTSLKYSWSFSTISRDAAPVAALQVSPTSGSAPLAVTADASASTDTDATPIATYAFNWGDGVVTAAQAGARATHTYSGNGTYTVKVTVTDTGGLSSTATAAVTVSTGVPVLNNDASAGYVTFTFDDGPGPTSNYPGSTQAMINQLLAEHIPAVFFDIGANVAAHPQIVAEEAADGFVVANHTYDHLSLTGESTGTAPLTDAQVTNELSRASAAIVAAGAPQPTLWRPPYGDVNANDNLLASQLGLRIVMDWGYQGSNIVDSQDWTGISAAQIVSNVTNGYTLYGVTVPGISAGSIIAMHDASGYSVNTIAALPGIVTYMNAHHLGATAIVRPDATGGVVPNYGGVMTQQPTQRQPTQQQPTHQKRPAGHTGA